MSSRRAYGEDTLAIMDRFFRALDACKEAGMLRYVDFCRCCGVPRSHFYTQRKDRHRGYFEVGWLVPLVRDYGVSAHWLLTGKGMMFNM